MYLHSFHVSNGWLLWKWICIVHIVAPLAFEQAHEVRTTSVQTYLLVTISTVCALWASPMLMI